MHLKYNLCVYEYLNSNHKDIVRNMLCDEFYIMQDKEYDIFYEITYYEWVVGFVCGNFYEDVLVCELCYILPDFRGLSLFSNALNILNSLFDVDIWLDLPNGFAIDSLIFNNLAFKLTDNIVISNFFLSFTNNDGVKIASRIYDYKNCGIVHLHEKIMSPLLDVDAINCPEREIINDEYFKRIGLELLNSLSI